MDAQPLPRAPLPRGPAAPDDQDPVAGEVQRLRRELSRALASRAEAQRALQQHEEILEGGIVAAGAVCSRLAATAAALRGASAASARAAAELGLPPVQPRLTEPPVEALLGKVPASLPLLERARSAFELLYSAAVATEEHAAEVLRAAEGAVPPPEGSPEVRELSRQVAELRSRVEGYGAVVDENATLRTLLSGLREQESRGLGMLLQASPQREARLQMPEVVRSPSATATGVNSDFWPVRSVATQVSDVELSPAPAREAKQLMQPLPCRTQQQQHRVDFVPLTGHRSCSPSRPRAASATAQRESSCSARRLPLPSAATAVSPRGARRPSPGRAKGQPAPSGQAPEAAAARQPAHRAATPPRMRQSAGTFWK